MCSLGTKHTLHLSRELFLLSKSRGLKAQLWGSHVSPEKASAKRDRRRAHLACGFGILSLFPSPCLSDQTRFKGSHVFSLFSALVFIYLFIYVLGPSPGLTHFLSVKCLSNLVALNLVRG